MDKPGLLCGGVFVVDAGRPVPIAKLKSPPPRVQAPPCTRWSSRWASRLRSPARPGGTSGRSRCRGSGSARWWPAWRATSTGPGKPRRVPPEHPSPGRPAPRPPSELRCTQTCAEHRAKCGVLKRATRTKLDGDNHFRAISPTQFGRLVLLKIATSSQVPGNHLRGVGFGDPKKSKKPGRTNALPLVRRTWQLRELICVT